MCKYNKPQGKQTQLSCQALCVDDLDCIGISQNLGSHECFLCTDEIMEPRDNNSGEFFKMPPGMLEHIFLNCRSHIIDNIYLKLWL